MIGTTKCAVNLRKTPENGKNVIKVIPKGQTLDVTQEDVPKGWIKTTVGKDTGYVMAAYLNIASGNDEEGNTPGDDNEGDDSGAGTGTPKGYGLITYNKDKTITVS